MIVFSQILQSLLQKRKKKKNYKELQKRKYIKSKLSIKGKANSSWKPNFECLNMSGKALKVACMVDTKLFFLWTDFVII